MRKKDPVGYPGDEAIRKALGETMKHLRLERKLTTVQAEDLLRAQVVESDLKGDHMNLGRAIGILVRRIRLNQGLTRAQLAVSSGLSVKFIASVEHGRETEGAEFTQIVRLTYGLKYSLEQFFEDLSELEKTLAASKG